MKAKRKENPVRFRAARSDASVGTIQRRIERDYQLPAGSVHLVDPKGKSKRADAKIKRLLREYERS